MKGIAVVLLIFLLVSMIYCLMPPTKQVVQLTAEDMFVYPSDSGHGFILVYGQGRYWMEEATPPGCYVLRDYLVGTGGATYIGPQCP